MGVALSQWRSKVDRMWTNAQTLFPVDLRTRDVHEEEATPAKALCHFATNGVWTTTTDDIDDHSYHEYDNDYDGGS